MDQSYQDILATCEKIFNLRSEGNKKLTFKKDFSDLSDRVDEVLCLESPQAMAKKVKVLLSSTQPKARYKPTHKPKERIEILQRWKKVGIDIGFVNICLDFARKQQSILSLQVDDKIKTFEGSLEFIQENKKKIEKIIELIDTLPFIEAPSPGIVFVSEDHKKPMVERQRKEPELERWRKRLNTFKRSEEHHKMEIKLQKQKYPTIRVRGKMFTNINVTLTLVYNHLLEKVGTSAYGKEKTVPLKYQEDMLNLFREITPDEFTPVFSLDRLRKRTSYINTKHPDILEDCKNYMLALVR